MFEKIVEKQPIKLTDENGYATILALGVLTLLTLMGISGITTSSSELRSATNDNLKKMAFYSAEASRAYIINNPNLYGVANIDTASPHRFPNNTDPYAPITVGEAAPFNLGNGLSFNGSVQYLGGSTPPRGSGYDTSKFRAHRYSATCFGFAPRNTTEQIEAGFYRIGL